MSSTASSALRPRQGEPAPCAASPSKVNSTDTSPVPPPWPQLTDRLLLTWVKRVTSMSSRYPSRTYQAFEPNCSSATPGHSTSVPRMPSASMTSLSASAATTFTACPEL